MLVDTLINARWIIPIVPENCVLENHALVINEGKIIDLLPQQDAGKYQAYDVIERGDHVLLPGLINAHTHAAMSLFKGLADDLPLREWLEEHIWPAEAECGDAEFVYDGSELAIAEMIRGGISCFNDMYFFPNETAAAAQKIGMRANIGLPIIDFPTRWAKDIDEYISKGIEVHDAFKSEPLISFSFSPHAPYTVSDGAFKKCQPIMDELGLNLHIHIHETAHEVEESVEKHGIRPLARLQKLGLLGPNFIAVHMTELNDAEIEMLATHGVHIVHCPESNLKLASGFCPVDKLLKAGINVALGTDGSASNNDLDMIGEMRTAALLAKGVAGRADALPAHVALEMATINGAKAIGLEDKIGSLEIGKLADITAINLAQLETQPIYDVISTVVYSASRSQVTDVWVNGTPLLKEGELTSVDCGELLIKANKWQEKLNRFHHRPSQAS